MVRSLIRCLLVASRREAVALSADKHCRAVTVSALRSEGAFDFEVGGGFVPADL